WLAKPYVLTEIISELLQRPKLPMELINSALFFAIELGSISLALQKIAQIRALLSEAEQKRLFSSFTLFDIISKLETEGLEPALQWAESLRGKKLNLDEERLLY